MRVRNVTWHPKAFGWCRIELWDGTVIVESFVDGCKQYHDAQGNPLGWFRIRRLRWAVRRYLRVVEHDRRAELFRETRDLDKRT